MLPEQQVFRVENDYIFYDTSLCVCRVLLSNVGNLGLTVLMLLTNWMTFWMSCSWKHKDNLPFITVDGPETITQALVAAGVTGSSLDLKPAMTEVSFKAWRLQPAALHTFYCVLDHCCVFASLYYPHFLYRLHSDTCMYKITWTNVILSLMSSFPSLFSSPLPFICLFSSPLLRWEAPITRSPQHRGELKHLFNPTDPISHPTPQDQAFCSELFDH